jgi:hypothetical protein
MANKFHKDVTLTDVHAITSAAYNDLAERDADTAWQVLENVNKITRVHSPLSYYILTGVDPTTWTELSSTGHDSFLDLTDTPSSYSGQAGKQAKVNDAETEIDFGQALRTTDSPQFNDLLLTGNLTVQGTTTTLDTETLLVEDKNIEIGKVTTPTDVTADGGGITLKGATDKTINWVNATNAWEMNQSLLIQNQMSIGGLTAPTLDMSLDMKEPKAFGLPFLTTTERDALTPTERMLIYNITVHKVEVYNGTGWIDLHAGTGDITMTPPVIDNQVIVADGPSGNMVKGAPDVFADSTGLGIGRTPTALLDVFSTGSSVFNLESNSPTLGALLSIKSEGDGATWGGAQLQLSTDEGANSWLMYMDNSSLASLPSVKSLGFWNGVSTVMTLTQFEGEDVVGINTTTPEWSLEVNGMAQIAQRLAERLGGETYAFHFVSDLDQFTSGGITTLPSGSYIFKESMVLPNRIVFETDAIIDITFEGAPNTEVEYSGNDTFMSGDPERVSLFSYKFLCTGTDALMFDLDQAALTLEKGRISMTGSNSGLGTVANSSAVIIRNGTVTNFVHGLNIDSPTACSISQMVATPYILSTGTIWNLLGTSTLGAIIDIQAAVAGPFGSLVYIDPLFDVTINLQNISQAGPGNFFKPATVTDSSINLANIVIGPNSVISAASEPTGGTRFTVSGTHNYQVGMVVTHEAFSESSYDGAYRVSAIPSSSIYVLESVPFVGTSTGTSATQYTQVITSGDPGVVDGDSINVTDTINYNGGYEVFSKLSDRFGIAKPFSVLETINYNNGSQDETSKYVTVFNCATQRDSRTIASGYVNNNATATGTIVNNTFRDMTFGTAGSALTAGLNTELFTLIDDVTGEYRYEGIVPFDGVINTSVTATSSGGAVEFRFSWQHDVGAGFVPLPDPVEGMNQIGSVAGNTSFTTPIALNPGDLIRPVITRSTGASGITTSYFNFTLR